MASALKRKHYLSSCDTSQQDSSPIALADASHDWQTPPIQQSTHEDENEDLDLVVMAVDLKEHGTVGCAYYTAREERMFCMEDLKDGKDKAIQSLLLDIQPTMVLVSPRINLDLQASGPIRAARLGSLVDDNEDLKVPYEIDIRPSSEFNIEAAKNKLVSLDSLFEERASSVRFVIPGEVAALSDNMDNHDLDLSSRQDRLLKLSAWINMENGTTLGCVSAVLTFLRRKRASQYLPDDPDSQLAYRVRDIEMFSITETMHINAETLLSLQIILPESHPNAFNQGPGSSGSKEDLSVYGLFHHLARTPQGKTQLRQYFLRPSLNIDLINSRLDFVDILTRPDNNFPMKKMSKSLSRIKNLRPVMVQLHKGINTGINKFGGFKSGVWATLLGFAFHAIDIRETFGEIIGAQALPVISEAMHVLDADQLHRIGSMINQVVDIDQSADQHRTVVRYGIDDKLDDMKRMYDGLDDLLSRAAGDIQRNLPAGFEAQVNVIYFPQLGFHITIPLDPVTEDPVFDCGQSAWERIFTTQTQAFFKDERMRQMDREIGDVYSMICEREIEISYELAQKILKHEKMLVTLSDMCGKIDSLLALAQGASLHKLSRPRITEDNIIQISQGRHILQEMTVPSFVPNNIFLVGGNGPDNTKRSKSSTTEDSNRDLSEESRSEGPSMLLLTGPNYSGKSIYQKQVALTVYLAHIGSFVPAESAVIGLTDKILTRITTQETISKAQSAFMIDLQQIALALNLATARSLIIIDEFGKGTDSSDGAGLATGVFRHLLSLGNESPKVIASTHFHEIFEQGFLKSHPKLAMGHMEVRVDQEALSVEDQVTYLYNFLPGISTQSYGTNCASLNGIPPPIIRRANLLAKLARQGCDLVSTCAGLSRDEEEELEEAERTARDFLSTELQEWTNSAGDDIISKLNLLLHMDEVNSAFENETRS